MKLLQMNRNIFWMIQKCCYFLHVYEQIHVKLVLKYLKTISWFFILRNLIMKFPSSLASTKTKNNMKNLRLNTGSTEYIFYFFIFSQTDPGKFLSNSTISFCAENLFLDFDSPIYSYSFGKGYIIELKSPWNVKLKEHTEAWVYLGT